MPGNVPDNASDLAAARRRGFSGRTSPRARNGFTLLELVIVVVVIGVLGAIAIPRMSVAAENARFKQLGATTSELLSAIDRYAAEHGGRTPAHQPDGSVHGNSDLFINRLLQPTDELGALGGSATLGPYLRTEPVNPFGTCNIVRIDGDGAGFGCGWRFDTATWALEPDHSDIAEHQAHPLYGP